MPSASVCVVCIVLLGLLPLPALAGQTDAPSSPDAMADRLLLLLNRERLERGLAPLAVHPGLRAAAEKHSRKMADMGSMAHDYPDYPSLAERLRAEEVCFTRAGENVAHGEGVGLGDIHDGFMQSPPHRGNILDSRYTDIGIAVFRDEAGGLWVTQVFAARPASDLPSTPGA